MTQSITEEKLWKAVLAEMELNFSGLSYDMWLSKTRAQNLTETTLEVLCPSDYVKTKVEKMFKPFLQESVAKVTKKMLDLIFLVGHPPTEPSVISNSPLFKAIYPTTGAPTAFQKAAYDQNGLNPKYTFENYVVGETNRLAYALAVSIADRPGDQYNPFFLYAGVGNGKTHLIQAIGNKLTTTRKDLKVIYCTGEKFTNDLIEALQKGKRKNSYTSDEFRKKYRTADVLIIDDIQFIAGKEATQEEFFHTFNDLHMNQKQIVLASDRPPREFTNIEQRLTSRFASGIMADIQAPDYELRTAILRKRRDDDKDEVINDILDFISETVTTNIRELEGAYLQILTYAKATGEPLTVTTAKKALGKNVVEERRRPLNINNILKAVCNYYAVKQTDLKGERRNKEYVIPRQVAMYLIYELTETPYTSIGELLGGRDHTTILHGVKKIEDQIKQDTRVKQAVSNIKQFIYQTA